MFSSELDRVQNSIASRSRGIVIGSALMIGTTASLVSAKTVVVTFAIVAAAFLIAAAARYRSDPVPVELGPVALYATAFFLYALLSATWAEVPELALEKACVALLIAAATISIVSMIRAETRPNLLHMGEGVCIGLFVGLLYLLIELLTDQSIKLWLYRAIGLGPEDLNPPSFFKWDGKNLLTISKEDLTRNIAPAVLFLWPAVTMIKGARGSPWRRAGAILLVLLTATVVTMSPHESSKLALGVSLGAFGLAHLSLRWAGRLTMLAWVLACLAVVPAALLAHRLELHNSPWLQGSARHRIIIWNFTAEKMLESPWFGIGANMTYVLGPEIERETPSLLGETQKRTLSIHSHNIYLQTWFELGLVGATLLTLVGLSILSAMRSLAPLVQPYAYATFASAATMAAASYGMWQYWFMALYGFCLVTFGIGARLLAQRSATPLLQRAANFYGDV
jgi:hypothetical protein